LFEEIKKNDGWSKCFYVLVGVGWVRPVWGKVHATKGREIGINS